MTKKIVLYVVCFASFFALGSPFNAKADPTRPLTKQSKATKQPSAAASKQPLTAIFNKNGNRYAIIEEKIYRLGDTYRGAKVIRISENQVILRGNQGTRQLTLIQKIKK